MGSCCVGPGRQHHSLKADHKIATPRVGIQPRYSGLRVQGTATSPPSTVFTIIAKLSTKCNIKSGSARLPTIFFFFEVLERNPLVMQHTLFVKHLPLIQPDD